MRSTLKVVSLLLALRLVDAQTIAAPTAIVDSSASDLGILQLVTPTTHASQVPITAIAQLSEDAFNFYTSYTQIDSFDFDSALADDGLIDIYLDGPTSLLDNPTSYLSRLHESASPYPALFSSSLMSQATGILLGYESLVTNDVLSMNATQAPVTPGMSINVGPAVTSGSGGSGETQASQGTGTTSTSKAAGVPTAHANAQVMVNAAAAAIGVLGVAWM